MAGSAADAMPAFFTKSRRVMVMFISPGWVVRDPRFAFALSALLTARGAPPPRALARAAGAFPFAFLSRAQDICPPCAICRPLDEWVCVGRVLGADVLVVPLDLLAGAVRDVAEMVRLGRPSGVLEVRAGHRAVALRIVHPFDPM